MLKIGAYHGLQEPLGLFCSHSASSPEPTKNLVEPTKLIIIAVEFDRRLASLNFNFVCGVITTPQLFPKRQCGMDTFYQVDEQCIVENYESLFFIRIFHVLHLV